MESTNQKLRVKRNFRKANWPRHVKYVETNSCWQSAFVDMLSKLSGSPFPSLALFNTKGLQLINSWHGPTGNWNSSFLHGRKDVNETSLSSILVLQSTLEKINNDHRIHLQQFTADKLKANKCIKLFFMDVNKRFKCVVKVKVDTICPVASVTLYTVV